MIETIHFNGYDYPKFQSEGFAARFAFPFASVLCKGQGLDIGCNRMEWKFPDAFPVDPVFNQWSADNLPKNVHSEDGKWDYIFSSHCLEHLQDWVAALDYWAENLKRDGVLFLYLPHPAQEYWLPWNNRKHIHSLSPELLNGYLKSRFDKGVFSYAAVTDGFDLNHSFYAIAQKS